MSISTDTLVAGMVVFALAVFLGLELITKVPSTLHTPLMSGTNFIHGIVLVGALTIAASVQGVLGGVVAGAAVFLGTLNVVGGFVVTDRMLAMFHARPKAVPVPQEKA
jgi:proton-translocating NAD(P)+ transhydrogenase subunit alpha